MEYKEENQQASLDMKQAKAPKKEKLTRKERRLRWKAARKARREEQKEYYRYAPALIRWWALYLWKPAVVILAAVILCVALFEPVYSFAVGILRLYVSGTIDKPLSLEVVSSAPFATEYRARVLYNGEDAYLELSCDLDTEEVRITGVRKVPQDNDVNFLSNTRSSEEIKFGAKITPVYLQDDFSTDSLTNVNGKQITFGRNTSVQMELLPEGQYLSTAVIQDPRGDSYYSAVITSTLEKGEMKGWRVDTRFFARDYY